VIRFAIVGIVGAILPTLQSRNRVGWKTGDGQWAGVKTTVVET
jgi:hypothetical protein